MVGEDIEDMDRTVTKEYPEYRGEGIKEQAESRESLDVDVNVDVLISQVSAILSSKLDRTQK